MRVSILTCVLNGVSTIGRAIDSVAAQSYPDIEYIVVDGASVDGTIDVINSYGSIVSKFISEKDESATHGLLKAISMATGDVVVLLMADDWLSSNAIEKIVSAFSTSEDIEIVTSGVALWELEEEGEITLKFVVSADEIELGTESILGVPYSAAHYWRRNALEKIGGFNPLYKYTSDRDLLMRAWLSNVREKTLEEPLYNYLQHDKSATLSGTPEPTINFLKEHVELCDEWITLSGMTSEKVRLIKRWQIEQASEIIIISIRLGNLFCALKYIFRYSMRGVYVFNYLLRIVLDYVFVGKKK